MNITFLDNVFLCARPPDRMTSFPRKQYQNAVIVPSYPKAVIWLVCDAYTYAAISLVRDTQMRQSHWCEQHTTLHANTELCFLRKKNDLDYTGSFPELERYANSISIGN